MELEIQPIFSEVVCVKRAHASVMSSKKTQSLRGVARTRTHPLNAIAHPRQDPTYSASHCTFIVVGKGKNEL
jgi:hypothetical protein